MTRNNFLLNQIRPHDCFNDSQSFKKRKIVKDRMHKEIKSILCSAVREETIDCFEETIGCFEEAISYFSEASTMFEYFLKKK